MNKRMGSEIERIRRLAKAWAKSEGETVVLYKKSDGTYDFTSNISQVETIIEYITPY